jgi:adenine-specific DNA methylase
MSIWKLPKTSLRNIYDGDILYQLFIPYNSINSNEYHMFSLIVVYDKDELKAAHSNPTRLNATEAADFSKEKYQEDEALYSESEDQSLSPRLSPVLLESNMRN